MKVRDILREKDIGNYNRIIKIEKTNENLSERGIGNLMSHSYYKRHKGAIKQVRHI